MLLSPEFGLAFVVFLTLYWLAGKRVATGAWAIGPTPSPSPSLTLDIASQPRIVLPLLAFLAYVFSSAPKFALTWAAFTLSQGMLFAVFNQATPRAKKWVAGCVVVLAAALLFFSKYYGPLREYGIEQHLPWAASMPPFSLGNEISFSFLCFQTITWCVFWARQEQAGAPFLSSLLLNGFLPTLTAGPILRAERFLPQLARPLRLRFPEVALGRICLGLFKKLVVANWLAAQWVDPVFKDPAAYSGLELLGAAGAYSLQIYFDFSGLSDLVYGIAALLGIHIPRNFNQPYLATNLKQFWQRWHISLSSWIRDYIYKPLGGNRRGFFWGQFALAASMLLSGAWHGAGWNFIVWAGMHIVGVWLHRAWCHLSGVRLPPLAGWLLTFAWVTLAWVWFRSASMADALLFFERCLAPEAWQPASPARAPSLRAELWGLAAAFGLAFAGFHFGPRLARLQLGIRRRLGRRLGWAVCLLCWTLLVSACLHLGPSGVPNFIYASF